MNAFSQAIEKASDNPKFIEAIGMPVVRGPWYDASLEVGHRRRSVSGTFPVSGPHGSGFLQIKATRSGGLFLSLGYLFSVSLLSFSLGIWQLFPSFGVHPSM